MALYAARIASCRSALFALDCWSGLKKAVQPKAIIVIIFRLDMVCSTMSLILIVNMPLRTCYRHGDIKPRVPCHVILD